MDVIGTDEFADWYGKLSEDEACAVSKAISVLESVGIDSEHVRVLEVPPVLRMRPPGLPHRIAFRIPESLRELSVPAASHRVLFAVERDGARIVLLYGYDSSRERARAPLGLPPAAHMILAAKVYGIYRVEADKTEAA